MSEFKVEVVELGPIEKHTNADSLSITKVYDYPVILRTGDYKEGDKAVYIPVDSIVPKDDPRFAFLGDHVRIRAKRLRGIFSMGLLAQADPAWTVGQDVREALRITKYEPPEPLQMGGDNEKCPFEFPKYTDIEGFRRWPNILQEGEEVWITEKIHGANGRWVFHDGRLWVGSHNGIKAENNDSLWWKIAHAENLAERLAAFPDKIVFGEAYGQVQDLKYGTTQNQYKIGVFDIMDLNTRKYLDVDEYLEMVGKLGLPAVPMLHRGPWSESLRDLSNGPSNVAGADHMREGIVIRPIKERWDDGLGRVILKLIGEDYLLRKEKK